MSNTPTLRSAIVPEQGYSFVSLDASQIELRVLANLSGDTQMIEDLKTGDLHLATATRMFGWTDDPDEMESRRYKAKQFNFALVYGADEFKLSEMLECSIENVLVFMEDHKTAYPRFYQWKDERIAKAREDGYVVSMFGRIRPLPELYAGSWKMREGAEREVVNTIVQGTAVDIVKLAMLQLRHEILDSSVRMLLQVHDEILLEVPDSILSETVRKIREELPQRFPDYPFAISVGTRYSELKEVKNEDMG